MFIIDTTFARGEDGAGCCETAQGCNAPNEK
jgi:hypothetical protein